MSLTTQQISEMVEIYCNRVVDEMDKETMQQILYEYMIDSFADYTTEEFEDQVVSVYGEEYYKELVDSVDDVEEEKDA